MSDAEMVDDEIMKDNISDITPMTSSSSVASSPEFRVNSRFDSWQQFITRFSLFTRRSGQRFVTDDSRIIEKFNFKFSSLDQFPMKLKYGYIKLVCFMAKKKKKGPISGSQRQRTGCKAEVYLNAQKEGTHCFLTISRCSFKHNHPTHPTSNEVQHVTAEESVPDQEVLPKRRCFSHPAMKQKSSNRREFMEHVLQSMMDFQRRGYFCDTALLTTSNMIYVHSVVLASICPKLLNSLNQNPFSTHAPNIVDLRPCDFALVSHLVDFMYTGFIETERIKELEQLCSNLEISIFVDGNRGRMMRSAANAVRRTRLDMECNRRVAKEDVERSDNRENDSPQVASHLKDNSGLQESNG